MTAKNLISKYGQSYRSFKMKFPEFSAPHLIQHRFEKINGKLPECVYLFDYADGTAKLQAAHTGVQLVEIIIIQDGKTKRASITDLSLNQKSSTTVNYYQSSIGSKIIQSTDKEIFEEVAKMCFPNVRLFSCVRK